MSKKPLVLSNQITEKLAKSARDKDRISGLTHNFYKYPARFSPSFASTAIELFSNPGDLILDPYMGGGTTIVEAMIAGRRVIGADLNALAVFIARVKTTSLSRTEKKSIGAWINYYLPRLSYHYQLDDPTNFLNDKRTKNLTLPKARFIKKIIAIAIASIDSLTSPKAKDFVRCAILKTGQWALDGRKSHTSLTQFRYKLKQNLNQMLSDLKQFEYSLSSQSKNSKRPVLIETDAALIDKASIFSKRGLKVDLVITSPPYPGLHILYHRWQVNGRRETPAPYWIAGCQDGQGDAYYNFGSRHQPGLHSYFETSLHTLKALRRVMRAGAYIIQMISFSNSQSQLPRYLANMETAGFKEVNYKKHHTTSNNSRIWRNVPNRKWHASLKGKTSGSKEAVLIHVAS